jgi:hypothetical protein
MKNKQTSRCIEQYPERNYCDAFAATCFRRFNPAWRAFEPTYLVMKWISPLSSSANGGCIEQY